MRKPNIRKKVGGCRKQKPEAFPSSKWDDRRTHFNFRKKEDKKQKETTGRKGKNKHQCFISFSRPFAMDEEGQSRRR